MIDKFLEWNLRHKYWGFALAMLITILGIAHGFYLPLRLSLTDLLPDHRESVLDMHAVEKEIGGIGYLIVMVGPMNAPVSILPKVVHALKKIPDIRYTFYERETYLLQNQILYLLPKKEIRELTKNAELLFNKGKSSLDLGIEDEANYEENLEDANAYFRKFKNNAHPDRYYVSKDGRYAMVLAKPSFDSEDLARSSMLVEAAEKSLKEELGDKIPFRLVGRYKDKVHDTHQITNDIKWTSLLSLFGIAFFLIWGLGAVRGALVTICGVTISMGWTVGIAQVLVGQINILTGFLLAILGGLGVEYGVHLIRRYYQERAMGKNHVEAMHISYVHVGRSLLSAAITSASAFLILSFSDFRGFSELGIIAGFGVLTIYLVYILCFPLIGDFLRQKPRFGRSLEVFGFYPFSSRWSWIFIPTVILAVIGFFRAEFEYDFERMHDLSKETKSLNQLTNDLFGKSMTPAALLAKDEKQAVELKEWLEDESRNHTIQEAISLYSIIPSDQDARQEKVKSIKKALTKVSKQELKEKTGVSYYQITRWLSAPPMKISDLPLQLKENFGQSGNIVLAYPRENLDQADSLRRFSDLLREAKAQFPGIKIGSDARVFVEILDHIFKDGKIVLLLFFVGAFLVFWIDFRNFFDALYLELQLLLGMVLLVCLMGLFGVRFSILNIAMVPAVLAAGIDIGVHVRHREKEGFRALASARFVAQAVQLSALTTVIGFGSLFFAEAGMLKGIAWISVLGQFSMYFICMILSPMLKDLIWRSERKKTVAKEILAESTLGD